MGRGVDGQDFAGGHLANEEGAVPAGLAEEDALGLGAEGDAVGDGEGVDVEGDEVGGAGGGVEGAEPEVAAVEEIVVVVPGPGREAVEVAGAGDFLGHDVDGGDVGGAVAEHQDFAGVAFGGPFARRAAAGRTFRAALAAGGSQQGHPETTHAGQQSSSR